MARVRLTREFRFEMAHALEGYDGACSQIHGHSYRLLVTVRGEPLEDPSSPKQGMVMDFGMLKQVVRDAIEQRYDHTLVIRRTASNAELVDRLRAQFDRIEQVDYQPTCENMVVRMAGQLSDLLPAGVELYSLRLHETASSYAEWFAEDQ